MRTIRSVALPCAHSRVTTIAGSHPARPSREPVCDHISAATGPSRGDEKEYAN